MTFSEISQQLTVIDYDILTSEVWVCYSLGGKEMNLQCTPDKAVELFKSAGYLKEKGDVLWDGDGEFKYYDWEEYVLHNSFSERDALNIAITHEQDKLVRGVYIHELPKVPDMI